MAQRGGSGLGPLRGCSPPVGWKTDLHILSHGCWLEASVSHHLALSIGLLTMWPLAFPRNKWSKREREAEIETYSRYGLSHPNLHSGSGPLPPYCICHTQQPWDSVGGDHTSMGARRGKLGSSWRLLTTGSQTELAPNGTSETSPFTRKPSSTIFHCSRWRSHVSIWLRQTLGDVLGFAPAVLLMSHPSAIPGSRAFKISQDSDHCSSPPLLLSGLKSLGLAACSWIIAVAS